MTRVNPMLGLRGTVDRLISGSQLRKNAFSGGVVAAGNLVLLLFSYPIYLRYLGTQWYGLWATLSVVIVFGQMGNLGINQAVARFVAEALGRGDTDDEKSFICASLALIMPPCLIVIIVGFGLQSGASNLLDLNEPFSEVARRILPLIGLLSACILLVDVLKGALIGIGKMSLANYAFLATRILQFTASIVLLEFGYGIFALLIGASVGYFTLGIIYTVIVFRHLNLRRFNQLCFSLAHVKALLGFGAYMFSSNVISMLMDPFNKIMLATYVGLDTVTFYEVGMKGVQAVRSIYEGAIRALFPRISELSGQNVERISIIRRIHRKSIHIVIATALPVFVTIFIFADYALEIWLGDQFSAEISPVLRWFLVGYMINLMSVPGFYILLGLNQAKVCFFAATLRSVAHFLVILTLLNSGLGLDLYTLVAVHTIAMIGASFFVIIMYTRAIRK